MTALGSRRLRLSLNNCVQVRPVSYTHLLIRFIREHDYEIVGNSYEHEMMNHLAVKDPEKYVLKISIKVEKTAL